MAARGGGSIAVYDEVPLRVEWRDSEANVLSWQLPVLQFAKAHLAGSWLAIEGTTTSGRAVCLLNHSDGNMQTFEFGLAALADWGVLSDGSLIIGNRSQAGSPGGWGIFHNSAQGWYYERGQALNGDLSSLAPLAVATPIDAGNGKGPAFNLPGVTENYTIAWDTSTLASGGHVIGAVVTDSDGLTGQNQIEVFVQNIILSLSIKRHSEVLWIIRHDYADITITLDNPNETPVAKYILERCESGRWATLVEIAPSAFDGGKFQFQDDYLETGKNYTYRVCAVNDSGAVIASSAEVII